MSKRQYLLEVCANSVASCLAAQQGGAKRVELCDNLYEGGTTPSHGMITLARKKITINLNVIIRPRGGDFCYSEDEFQVMRRDIMQCKTIGVDGVVIGVLLPNGQVDVERTRQLVDLAYPMSVTFHRAFDMTPDPFIALDDVMACGAQRILTSGQANKAPDGEPLLKKLVEKAAGRIVIMPGSGIKPENIVQLAQNTGATEFHASGKKRIAGNMVYRKPGISMGSLPVIPEYDIEVSDAGTIQLLTGALKTI